MILYFLGMPFTIFSKTCKNNGRKSMVSWKFREIISSSSNWRLILSTVHSLLVLSSLSRKDVKIVVNMSLRTAFSAFSCSLISWVYKCILLVASCWECRKIEPNTPIKAATTAVETPPIARNLNHTSRFSESLWSSYSSLLSCSDIFYVLDFVLLA